MSIKEVMVYFLSLIMILQFSLVSALPLNENIYISDDRLNTINITRVMESEACKKLSVNKINDETVINSVYENQESNVEISILNEEAETVSENVYIPEYITTIPSTNSITISWGEVAGAEGYDIEADGTVIDNGTSTTYVHTELSGNTTHEYRVRAKEGDNLSDWSEIVPEITLMPKPENIITESTVSSITISWDEVTGATGYDIEVDGTVIDNGTNTIYEHNNLEEGSIHTYRIMSKSGNNTNDWTLEMSEATLMPTTHKISCEEGEEITCIITGEQICSANGKAYKLTYNPEALELIESTNITITAIDEENGEIQFTYKLEDSPEYININFNVKASGETDIILER